MKVHNLPKACLSFFLCGAISRFSALLITSLFFLCPAASPVFCQNDEDIITLADLLTQSYDISEIYLPDVGEKSKQFSSYDRSGWEANRDWANYLRSSRTEGNVCAEMEGPGCIMRIWSANPSGRILFYLDGAEEPAIDIDFEQLFLGNVFPFEKPFAYRISGANCYFPIPYQKSCKVVLKDNNPLYYHIGYTTWGKETKVETYSPESALAAKEAIDQAKRVLENPGQNLVDLLYPEEKKDIPIIGKALPGMQMKIFEQHGSKGRIVLLELQGKSYERDLLRKTLLKIFWDDDLTPAVNCPLGDFFGIPFEERAYKSLPLGCTEKGGYCLFPMPFENSVRIEVFNQGRLPVEISGRIIITDLPESNLPYLRFHAGWRRENPCRTFDYPILETHGMGKFVGCALYIDNPRSAWWGEGDERIYVDNEKFPSYFGTGTEDYFGDAWGFCPHIMPYEGCTLLQDRLHGNKTCVYRFHITDSIPFSRSFKMTIENYAKDIDYSSIAWWYQASGGNDFFKDLPLSLRVPKGPTAIGAIEGETLDASCMEGSVIAITDQDLPKPLSNGSGLVMKGAGPFALRLPVEKAGCYNIIIGMAQDISHPEIQVSGDFAMPISSIIAPAARPGFLSKVPVGSVYLTPENNTIFLNPDATYAESLRIVLDYIYLKPIEKKIDAIEAEDLKVTLSKGGLAVVEHVTLPWSNGSQLRFTAEEAMAVLKLNLPITMDGEYTIIGLCTSGDDYGPFTLAINDNNFGDIVPERLEGEILKTFTLGPISLAAGDNTISIATGTKVGLDCFTLLWRLGNNKNVIEGEMLKILDSAHGSVTVQELDSTIFSRGQHLWFRAEEEGAFVESLIPVEKSGDYSLKIYFCNSWDYGIVKVLVDGEPVGEPIDCYSPKVATSGAVDFGVLSLKEGERRIKFLITGKNQRSAGYFMGVDGLILTPVEKK